MAVAAVLTERYFTHQEVAQLIEPVSLNETERIDHVAERLRHLLAAVEQEAMSKNPLRQRDTSGHQECGPVDRMEARDVLTDDVCIGRPIAPFLVRSVGIAECRDVVCQGVDPDIHDMLFVTRHWNAPIEGRARNRQVLQARLDEAHDLVAAFRRHNEARIFLVKIKQPVLIGRKAEEIAFLLDPFDGRTLRAVANAILADFRFLFTVIGFVTHGVPTGISTLVDIAIVGHRFPDSLAGLVMPLLRGADIVIVGAVQHVGHLPKCSRIAVCKLPRRDAFLARALQHLDAVFVRTGQKENILAIQSLKTRHGIGRDKFIRMADVRLSVWISDRGSDVIFFTAHYGPGLSKFESAPE